VASDDIFESDGAEVILTPALAGWALAVGYRDVQATVLSANTNSKSVLKATGFVPTGKPAGIAEEWIMLK
jgi:hypothetical protein